MKKFALILIMVATVTIAFGQKNVRQSASNYLKAGKLDKALEAINACILDPSTASDAKAWFIRGNTYLELANTIDENYKKLEADPLSKSLESYKKAIEYDPKKEYYEDIVAKLNWQRNNYYNAAVDNYNNKLYKDAMINFGKSAEVLELANIQDTTAMLNAAACATLANEREASKEYYIKLLKANYKSINVFITLSDIYRQEKDSANSLKYVRMGQLEYPNDLRLYLAETNIYLTFNNTLKALNNLKVALAKDSTNYSVAFALGTIYDNISNDTSKSVMERQKAFNDAINAYKTSIRIHPSANTPKLPEVKVGMTKEMVLSIVGKPEKINETVYENSKSEQWVYADLNLYFDESKQLKGWQQSKTGDMGLSATGYFEGNYNLGALYVNKAATINDEATKLPLDASAQYDKLMKEANTYLGMALPYLEKAIEMQPTDSNTLYTLKQIYTRTNQPEKVKAVQEKLNNLPK